MFYRASPRHKLKIIKVRLTRGSKAELLLKGRFGVLSLGLSPAAVCQGDISSAFGLRAKCILNYYLENGAVPSRGRQLPVGSIGLLLCRELGLAVSPGRGIG